jgi:hypothetical protein
MVDDVILRHRRSPLKRWLCSYSGPVRLSSRNPIVLGVVVAVLAAVATAIAGGSTDVAYISMLVLLVAGLLYAFWPEIRETRRHRPHRR